MELKQILADIARAIVDTPDAVNVVENVDGDDVELILTVSEEDTGMVIGRHGKHELDIITVNSFGNVDRIGLINNSAGYVSKHCFKVHFGTYASKITL